MSTISEKNYLTSDQSSSRKYVILYLMDASVYRFWSAPCLRETVQKALDDLGGDMEVVGEFRQALVEMLGHPALYTERAITKISSCDYHRGTSLVLLIV